MPCHSLTGLELPFLKRKPAPIKMTLPSPTQFPAIAFKRGVTDRVYPDHSALLWDVVEIMKSDLSRVSSEGVVYIQIDAPRYSYYLDLKWRSWVQTELQTDPEAASVQKFLFVQKKLACQYALATPQKGSSPPRPLHQKIAGLFAKIWRASANFCSYKKSNPALSSGTAMKAGDSLIGTPLARPIAGLNSSNSVGSLKQRSIYLYLPLSVCGWSRNR